MSNYVSPSPEELRTLLQDLGLSRSEAGKLVDVTGNKVGKWCSSGAIPYSVLFTIIVKSCDKKISADNWRNELK